MPTSLRCHCAVRSPLKAIALQDGLPALRCPDCGAVLLQMDDWRHWRAAQPATATATHEPYAGDTAAPAPLPAEEGRARHCPACARLMERLPVDAQHGFRIDRCGPCQYLWLDDGEWAALAHLGLTLQLDGLLSQGGQRRIQNERLQATRMRALRQRHGDTRIDEVMRFRDWLADQPLRDELLALLQAH